jgi:hypothetical protein
MKFQGKLLKLLTNKSPIRHGLLSQQLARDGKVQLPSG